MNNSLKIYVAGHRGMVGSAIMRELKRQGYNNIITRTHNELDLIRQTEVEDFFASERPDCVFLAAARVGGVAANQDALAEFLYENAMIEMNVIHSAWENGCKHLVFIGSGSVYPKDAMQPIKESSLLTSPLEKANEGYALAKIAGLKYCDFLNKQYGTNYVSVMSSNLYGPNDNYSPIRSHVLPALIRRFHEAKESGAESVTCWGDGSSIRDFLYADDLAQFCVSLMDKTVPGGYVNAGTGKGISIKELTEIVAGVIGYNGEVLWDINKPSGAKQILLDSSKANQLGWFASTNLEDGVRLAYQDYLLHCKL